ncbi:hypothetical protein GH733_018955 [Mirounga leonina]|nr:hypothetical protein GH733_018955 [Mirounga leonina]
MGLTSRGHSHWGGQVSVAAQLRETPVLRRHPDGLQHHRREPSSAPVEVFVGEAGKLRVPPPSGRPGLALSGAEQRAHVEEHGACARLGGSGVGQRGEGCRKRRRAPAGNTVASVVGGSGVSSSAGVSRLQRWAAAEAPGSRGSSRSISSGRRQR